MVGEFGSDKAKPGETPGKRPRPTVAKKAAKPAVPPLQPQEPVPPPNLTQAIATGLARVDHAAQAVNSVASIAAIAADPAGFLAGAMGSAADDLMSNLVGGMAQAIGPYPAATMTKMTLGIPHAHVKHPPSGPPPLPPIPFPPMGPIMVGNNVTVLINGTPSARCGDFGFNPTCCGVVPPLSAMFEIITGSSNVYIGGTRAARANIDVTMHCFRFPMASIPVKIGKLAAVAGKISKVTSKVGKVASVAGTAAQVTSIAAGIADAEANDDAAMASAIGLSAAMMAAQAAADAAAAALTVMIGTDQPMIPPVGTPGMILAGSPNVLIGGFPLPSMSAIAQGLFKRLKGLRHGPGGPAGGAGPAAAPS